MLALGIQGAGRIAQEPTRRAGRGGAAFRLPGAPAAESPDESGAVAASLSLELQEAARSPAPPPSDADIASRAEAALDGLGGLQLAMLGGGGGEDGRAVLATLVALPEPLDPLLAEVTASIRLRARIELARAKAHCLRPG
ncbi:class II flagellar assembly regulator [Humitalea rosea]|uniref:Class II flagellar assembly regulator n=2 Tax=Humitalea rosea TaxID=990373 RepID=A0A2W7IGZ3_9PROT|nr:class II flagellar assembly regulator [Humitalea rosea]